MLTCISWSIILQVMKLNYSSYKSDSSKNNQWHSYIHKRWESSSSLWELSMRLLVIISTAIFCCTLVVQIYCTSVNCTSIILCSLLLDLKVHSLCNLFLLFLVQQMSSDSLGLLLGLTLPLHSLSSHTGWTYLNGTAAEHVFLVWICVKVLATQAGRTWMEQQLNTYFWSGFVSRC